MAVRNCTQSGIDHFAQCARATVTGGAADAMSVTAFWLCACMFGVYVLSDQLNCLKLKPSRTMDCPAVAAVPMYICPFARTRR